MGTFRFFGDLLLNAGAFHLQPFMLPQQQQQQTIRRFSCWLTAASRRLSPLNARGVCCVTGVDGVPSAVSQVGRPFAGSRDSFQSVRRLQQSRISSSSSDVTPTISAVSATPPSLSAAVASVACPPDAAAAASLSSLCVSVVKVYSDYTDPNYALPWQMQRQGSSTGSGFIIGGTRGPLGALGLQEKRILTNAHCVAWHNRLHVRKHGSPTKYSARVLAVGHECDLALLTVDDEAFWKDTEGLEFGEIPALQDGVIVLGYPRGGDNLCITSGVVSRVDVNTYAHSNTALLCVQIDAAINPGNSGGPAMKDGKVVGVAFQGWDAAAAQNVGYVVPPSIIGHFLEDLTLHKKYTGFPSAGVVYQQLENESMQEKLGLTELRETDLPQGITPAGIFVTATDSVRTSNFLKRAKAAAEQLDTAAAKAATATAEGEFQGSAAAAAVSSGTSWGLQGSAEDEVPKADPMPVVREAAAAVEAAAAAAAAAGKPPLTATEKKELWHQELEKRIGLKPEDVILAVEGVDVAEDGTVHFRDMERVGVSHVISGKFMGDTLAVTVLRDRNIQNVVVPLEAERSLIPKHQWGMKARYLVYGGLVFCPLSLEYLKDEFGPKFHERAPSSLLRPLSEVFASVEGEEPIVLTQILASDLTSGYSCRNCLLSSVDGVKARNMRHLAELLGIKTPQQHCHHQQQGQQQQSDFVTFVLEEKLQIVLHRGKAEAMLQDILQQHAIHNQTSEQL